MSKTVTAIEFLGLYDETQQTPEGGLLPILRTQKGLYNPDGWIMLECQMLDSSLLGSRVILPYGGSATYKTVPDHPVSPRGLASDMSVVIAVLPVSEIP